MLYYTILHCTAIIVCTDRSQVLCSAQSGLLLSAEELLEPDLPLPRLLRGQGLIGLSSARRVCGIGGRDVIVMEAWLGRRRTRSDRVGMSAHVRVGKKIGRGSVRK